MVDEKTTPPEDDGIQDGDIQDAEFVEAPADAAPENSDESSAAKRKGGRGPLLALIILGLIIVGGYLLWPTVEPLLVAQMRSEAPGTMAAIQQLDHRMAQLEAANNQYDGAIATIKASLDDLSGQLDGLAKAMPGGDAIAKLGEKLAGLETNLSELGRVVEQTASAGGSAALDLLNREFESLKSKLTELASSQPASNAAPRAASTAAISAAAADSAELRAENSHLRETVTALQGRLEQLEDTVRTATQERRQTGQGHGLVLAVGQLRQTVLAGRPYGPPLAAVAALAKEDQGLTAAIGSLRPGAKMGIATERALSDQFPSVARAVLRAEGSQGDGFVQRTWQRLSALVTVRRIGEVEGQETDAVLARTERRLASGDLAAAVELMANLAGPSGDAARAWLERAQGRLAAESALAALQSRAIAGLGDG
jgi:hypothetical protein